MRTWATSSMTDRRPRISATASTRSRWTSCPTAVRSTCDPDRLGGRRFFFAPAVDPSVARSTFGATRGAKKMTTIPTGRFVWFDYVAKDLAKAQGFFGELFNWKTQEIPTADG